VTLPPEDAKAALREEVRARRRAGSDHERADVEAQLAVRVGAIAEIAELVADPDSGCVAVYASYGTEPGTGRMRDLLELAGVKVLLPVIGADGGLDFAWDSGTLALGPVSPGIPEPTGPVVATGMHGLVALGCRVVLTPALAVDLAGHRIGKAGGYYDRLFAELDDVDPALRPALVAVVHDDDVVTSVPTGSPDRRVDAVLTPTRHLLLG
jgi:5-formyltetrahydrofolate cyclo-ligase